MKKLNVNTLMQKTASTLHLFFEIYVLEKPISKNEKSNSNNVLLLLILFILLLLLLLLLLFILLLLLLLLLLPIESPTHNTWYRNLSPNGRPPKVAFYTWP